MAAHTPVGQPAAAPNQRQAFGNMKSHEFKDCYQIGGEIHLVPPALIEKLRKGERLPFTCHDAIFIDELIEIAKRLGRTNLVALEVCKA